MAKSSTEPKNPLILQFHRLMDSFAKSDDERDFYLDRTEGFIVYIDLDKSEEDLAPAEKDLSEMKDRFALIPKMTFYETKKFMEGFINEKVYDIDTKEKLLDIVASKEAREHFLEYIYDHLTELEKWQQYYHERSRIRIIEWLRDEGIQFVFEEDLDLGMRLVEKLKEHLFDAKVPKDVQSARDVLEAKAMTYYSNEALNPRPKRGRPPKQAQKVEAEPELTSDIYKTVPPSMRHFLYLPDFSSSSVTFSAKFDTEAQLIASLRGSSRAKVDTKLEALSQRLESLQNLSSKLRQDVDLGNIGSGEERLLHDVSKAEIVDNDGKRSVMDIAKGFLPKRKGRTPKSKEEIQEALEHKRKAGIKQVTP
ncbi:MAG: UPF0158 family protein, partial [Simkaniaceae bacterium]|nr:UPF0158 family protein [Simkaniaceae bacterium]